MPTTHLITFHSISITGPDATTFLQGQLTCDVTKVAEKPSFGAYCDNKGRMLANFWIEKITAGYQIILPEAMIDSVMPELKKYGAFSKVEMSSQPFDAPDIETDKRHYIDKGIAFIYPQTSLSFTPQMIDWEKHGGVSFEKGCYLGQEVVARTQHLGKLKRHLRRFSAENTATVNPGDTLVNSKNETIGILCDSILDDNTIIGLAVLQDRALNEPIILNASTATVETI